MKPQASSPESEKPHLGVLYFSKLPKPVVDEFLAEIEKDGLQIDLGTHDGMFAGIEWLMPTAVVVYILRPYLDAMLSELGKDHYRILKRAAKTLAKNVSGLGLVRHGTPGKIPAEPVYSLAFSIMIDTGEGWVLKFLLQPELSDSDTEIAFTAFFTFLDSMVDATVTTEVLDRLQKARAVGRTLLVAYDFADRKIVPVDPYARPIAAD